MRKITIPEQLKISETYEDFFVDLEHVIENSESEINFFFGKHSQELLAENLTRDLSSSPKLKHCKINFYQAKDISTNSQEFLLKFKNSLLIAIGGGKILDQVKYLASASNSKFISIPTLISHDGICSPVAVINGTSYGAVMPSAMLVPLFIIEKSNILQIYSGIGDLIANLSAIEDWKLAAKFNNEPIDDFAIMLSKQAAMSVISLLEAESKVDCFQEKFFLRSLVEALAISGIAMSISGNSRPCSGAEHMISHAIDQIYGHGSKSSHGIQVLIATLFLENLRNSDLIKDIYADPKEIELSLKNFKLNNQNYNSTLFKILKKFSLPLYFHELGINQEELYKVLELAPQTRKNRFTILDLFLTREVF